MMKFSHRGADGKLYWQGPRRCGDSRVEQISCDAQWFYSTMLKGKAVGKKVRLKSLVG